MISTGPRRSATAGAIVNVLDFWLAEAMEPARALRDGRTAAQGRVSGHPCADMFCEHTMNQGLVADLEAIGFGAESFQHLGVQADGNKLSSLATDRRATDTAHRAQLFG